MINVQLFRKAAWGLSCASLLACAAPSEGTQTHEEAPVVAEAKDALWANSKVNYWANGVIPVCFSRRPDVDLVAPTLATWNAAKWARFDAAALEIQQLIEDNYEHIPNVNIDFTGWGHCSDVPNEALGNLPGTLRVVIQIDKPPETQGRSAPVFRHCVPGFTGRPFDCGGGSGFDASTEAMVFVHDRYAAVGSNDWDVATLHEFGHALGFEHELDRNDNQLGQAACPAYAVPNTNTGDFLTKYDQDSIMNATYCHMNPWLSEGDKLGLEIAYPDQLTAPFHGEHSFRLGGGLLVREDDKLVLDWLTRGADTLAFYGGTTPDWTSGTGLSHWYGWTLLTVDLSDPTVTLEYQDYRARKHKTTQTVSVDDSVHTAIVMTLI